METHLVEYKQSWSDEYLEWIAGYASAEGGTLYIGKDDSGNTVGQEKPVFEETKYSFCLSMKPLFVADEIGNATDESQNGPGKSHGFLYNSHELPSNFLANFLESFTENDAKVIEMIAENGRITAKEAASRIGISDRAVRSIIKKLKGCGAIKRVGPDKGGYWEVIIDEE